jgi:phosphoenolpyruvate-protein phosphotransferase
VRELRGVAASPGLAVGIIRRVDVATSPAAGDRIPPSGRADGVRAALAALSQAAAQLEDLAADLRNRDRPAEADIVETGVLMAHDPALRDAVVASVQRDGLFPVDAILTAAESFAEALAALDSGVLAARAADVRSVGRRAARIASSAAGDDGHPAHAGNGWHGGEAILVADDLGPADVAELSSDVRGVALSQGAVTTHAAIVARSLGLPAVVAIGDALAGVTSGSWLLVDGAAGTVLVDPPAEAMMAARTVLAAESARRDRAAADRNLPAVTRDGARVHVLANASTAAEVAFALDSGAEGVGLLRSELGLLDAVAWPGVAEHSRMLDPILQLLGGRMATVRILDFGGDKLPPFLAGTSGRGIQLLRQAPQALEDQLEAIVGAGAHTDLGVLIPMVIDPDDVDLVRESLGRVLQRVRSRPQVRVGAMIEVPAAVAMLEAICNRVDFISIGTNDLTHFQLGLDRGTARAATTHHPAVLRLIHDTVAVAHAAGIPVAVCGEAASHAAVMPLLLGLGVDELSVGAARVGEVRRWVRSLDGALCRDIAERALRAQSADEVEQLSAPLRASMQVV